jgi:hypothetical protein
MIRRGIPYVFLAGPVLLALDCLFGDSAGKSLASARSLARISQHGRASIFVTAMPAATIVHFPAQDPPKPALTRGRRMTLERILRENTGRYESSTITYAFSNKPSRTCIKSNPETYSGQQGIHPVHLRIDFVLRPYGPAATSDARDWCELYGLRWDGS